MKKKKKTKKDTPREVKKFRPNTMPNERGILTDTIQ